MRRQSPVRAVATTFGAAVLTCVGFAFAPAAVAATAEEDARTPDITRPEQAGTGIQHMRNGDPLGRKWQ
jgi:hypothetical protein